MTRTVVLIHCTVLAGLMTSTYCAQKKEAVAMSITIESPAFKSMQMIPSKYTCDGEDVSPPLTWRGVPPEAKSLVLISDDPDAPVGTWVHWVCYDIPPTVDSLPESVAKTDTLPCGGRQGITDFRRTGYGGPCPPSGTHRYFFKIHALDTVLDLPGGRTKKQIEQAMQGHILAQGELVGKYARRR
jgi:Raf kinase inhibitor-like YbhB/YbcL family protein